MRSWAAALAVSALASFLYLPLLSIQYEQNGVNEARAVETLPFRHGLTFFPNHMLFRPVGIAAWKAARALGYEGRALWILQVFSAVAGAAVVGMTFVTLRRLGVTMLVTSGLAAWLAMTVSLWRFSTDVAYITPAAAFVAAALAVLVQARTQLALGAVGALLALAILGWQANLFSLVPVLVAILLNPIHGNIWARVRSGAVVALTCASLVVGVYLAVGFLVVDLPGLSDVAVWAFGRRRLPMWGAWQPERVRAFAETAVQSVVEPTWAQWFLAPLVLLPFLMRRRDAGPSWRTAGWLLAGYVAYVPFLTWWDPYSTRWLIVPNIFLAGALGILWQAHVGGRLPIAIPATIAAVLGGVTFATTIWPKHSHQDAEGQMAACVASRLGPDDLFVATDWAWYETFVYLHGRQGVSILGEAVRADKGQPALQLVIRAVGEQQARGGHAFMLDPSFYRRGHLEWLTAQTGVTPRELAGLVEEPAFECKGWPILRLKRVPAG